LSIRTGGPIRPIGTVLTLLWLVAVRPIRAVMALWRLVAFGTIRTFLPFLTFGTKTVGLKLPQSPQQGFNFAFVSEFLALGQFNQFQNFLHLLQSLLQRFDNPHDLVDCLTDGRAIRPGGAWCVSHRRLISRPRRHRAGRQCLTVWTTLGFRLADRRLACLKNWGGYWRHC
jgi:hypothetical protein